MIKRRGLVLHPSDLDYTAWPDLMEQAGLNVMGIHSTELTAAQQAVVDRAIDLGIDVEYETHFTSRLMTEDKFAQHPGWFAMDILGQRDQGGNPCTSSADFIEHATAQAAAWARAARPTTHRYYPWARDNKIWCNCSACASKSPADQNVDLMHAYLQGIRQVDPQACVSYAAYLETFQPPDQDTAIDDGLFLEFAPYRRNFLMALDDAHCHTNTQHVAGLKKMLTRFRPETAKVLEYWLDVSYWSNYKNPYVQVLPNVELVGRDIAFYASVGLADITTFACGMNRDYFERFGTDVVMAYGQMLSQSR